MGCLGEREEESGKTFGEKTGEKGWCFHCFEYTDSDIGDVNPASDVKLDVKGDKMEDVQTPAAPITSEMDIDSPLLQPSFSVQQGEASSAVPTPTPFGSLFSSEFPPLSNKTKRRLESPEPPGSSASPKRHISVSSDDLRRHLAKQLYDNLQSGYLDPDSVKSVLELYTKKVNVSSQDPFATASSKVDSEVDSDSPLSPLRRRLQRRLRIAPDGLVNDEGYGGARNANEKTLQMIDPSPRCKRSFQTRIRP